MLTGPHAPADVRRSLIERGGDEWEADHFQEMYQLFRDGESANVTDVVEQITGHPARTVEEYITRAADVLMRIIRRPR